MQSRLFQELSQNPAVMESMMDMRNAQPPKDRMHYFDRVFESSNDASNAALLQKLYMDIISKSNIDFGSIPDSKGNLIKYKEYKLLERSLENINELFKGIQSDEVKLTNELHDFIISAKKDFEFGFNFDVEIIKITYNTAVMSLYEMINLCILSYAQRIREDSGVTVNFSKSKRKCLLIVKNCEGLVKMWKTGQWSKLIAAIKKNPRKFAVKESATTANEAGIISGGATAIKTLGGLATGSASVGQMAEIGGLTLAEAPIILKIAGVLTVLLALLFIIRGLISLFFAARVRMANYIRTQKEFVDFEKQKEFDKGDDRAVSKFSKISDKLENLATRIEVKIVADDKTAKKDLMDSNKKDYSTSELRVAQNNAFGSNIEF